MDKRTLHHYEALLRKEQETLKSRIANMAAETPNDADRTTAAFPEFGEKEEDNAAEVATFQDNLSVESHLEASLHDIDRALAKIADGTYGSCEICGEAIDAKRLEVSPAAARCLRHASHP